MTKLPKQLLAKRSLVIQKDKSIGLTRMVKRCLDQVTTPINPLLEKKVRDHPLQLELKRRFVWDQAPVSMKQMLLQFKQILVAL